MTREPVPPDVLAAVTRVWLARPGEHDPADAESARGWALSRWPLRPVPESPETLAFWVLSISYQDGR